MNKLSSADLLSPNGFLCARILGALLEDFFYVLFIMYLACTNYASSYLTSAI